MPSPSALYDRVHDWLKALAYPAHRTVRRALARRVTAVLLAQRLTPADLMRALPCDRPVPARSRYAAVAGSWDHAALLPEALTPVLVAAALKLAPRGGGPPHLALDTVRCGGWESFTIGLVWRGRVVPLAWATQPYPMPKGVFTPAVCALILDLAAAWPAHAPRPHLVADRGFPSTALFRTLRAVGWGFTVRLRAGNWVSVDGERQVVRARLTAAADQTWTLTAATFASGPRAVAAQLVVGRGLGVLAWHQRDAGSARHRTRQRAQRLKDLAHKHPRQAPDGAAQTDTWMVLFTTHTTWLAAVRSYRQRWATEGSYRDAQSGWDGQHGWGLEEAVGRLGRRRQVEALLGLWALGALVQTWVGEQVVQATAGPAQVARAEWTTSGRLSVWGAGRLAFTDRHGRLTAWLEATLRTGCARLGAEVGAAAVAPERATADRLAA